MAWLPGFWTASIRVALLLNMTERSRARLRCGDNDCLPAERPDGAESERNKQMADSEAIDSLCRGQVTGHPAGLSSGVLANSGCHIRGRAQHGQILPRSSRIQRHRTAHGRRTGQWKAVRLLLMAACLCVICYDDSVIAV